jgi:hypothetical protein
VASGLRVLVDQLERVISSKRQLPLSEEELLAKTSAAVEAMASAIGNWDGKSVSLSSREHEKLAAAIAELESMPRPTRGDRKVARQLHANGLSLIGQPGFEALAVDKMQAAHAADPLDVQILNDLAYAEQQAGHHRAALDHLLRTLRLAPGRTSAWVNLAETLPFVVDSPDQGQRSAMAMYVVGYWFSKDRTKTLEYLRTMAMSPDVRKEVSAAAEKALSWLERVDSVAAGGAPAQAAVGQ